MPKVVECAGHMGGRRLAAAPRHMAEQLLPQASAALLNNGRMWADHCALVNQGIALRGISWTIDLSSNTPRSTEGTVTPSN